MREPTGPLSKEDTVTFVEAAIRNDRAVTERKLLLRKLQVKYRYGERGGVDMETGEIQKADGTRDGSKVTEEELQELKDSHDEAELAQLEFQALSLRLKEQYQAPMAATPNDDGDWIVPNVGPLTGPAAETRKRAEKAADNGERGKPPLPPAPPGPIPLDSKKRKRAKAEAPLKE